MRVFLDTNVLVSAFSTRGLCNELCEYVLPEEGVARLSLGDHAIGICGGTRG